MVVIVAVTIVLLPLCCGVLDVLVAVLFVIMVNGKSVMTHMFGEAGRGELGVMGWGRITRDGDDW